MSCQIEWQKTNVGERNPRYARVEHKCDYCGKAFGVPPYKLSQAHLFCSKTCRQEWYANVWSQSKEWRNESRKRAVEILSSGKVSQTNSKPQAIIDDMLDAADISYIREKAIGTYSVDNYLDKYGLCIEVMGDFWHTNPTKYDLPKYDKQKVSTLRDARKRECIKEQTGYYPLYLWECDIIRRPEVCLALVKQYIHSNGDLPNYNSYNYSMVGESVSLKEDIIIPFQERYKAYCD